MGNCGSAPAVKDDPPPARRPAAAPVRAPPPQAMAVVEASKPDAAARPEEKHDLTTMITKPKPVEIVQAGREPAKAATRPPEADDDDDDDDDESGGWRVRRRVSRRLSLEVQKKPSSKADSPSAWGDSPSAAEQAAWDAEADADLMSETVVMSSAAKGTDGKEGNVQAMVEGAAVAGKSRLGRGAAAGEGSDDEAEEEVPGPWRARRRGRRLSLEVEKAPDLVLLAALRRSSSAPIQGDHARRVVLEDMERQRLLAEEGTGSPPLPRYSGSSPSSSIGKGGGESAVTSPAIHSATVIDFAQTDAFEHADDDEHDTPSSVAAAESLLKETSEGSPNQFRAKRRKSRRLSLEIEKKPDEAVLAAVRRTHSAPVTAAAAEAAMGAAAWASVVAGKDGGGSPGQSPLFQPSPAERGEEAPRAVTTSKQEARAIAWGGGQLIDFAQMDDDDEDSDADERIPQEGDLYVRENPQVSSRRRSMDVYKKAIASGSSHERAAEMAGLDPRITNYDELADEEADLLSPRGGVDFAEWKGEGEQAQPGQTGFKSRWADYNPAGSAAPVEGGGAASVRFPDMSAFGNESQPAPTPAPLAGISV